MNIALTGTSGLIGSLLTKDLRNFGHNILCISSSNSSPESNTFSYEEVLSKDFKFDADCLIHLASLNSELKESDIKKEVSLSSNAIKCMKALKCKKMIFFSSIKVYGDNSFEFKKFDEDSLLGPLCFYGEAKKQCEEFINQKSKDNSFDYIIFRLPPLLINHPQSNLGKIFKFIDRGWPMPTFKIGDLNQRSFLSYELLLEILISITADIHILKNEVINLSISHTLSTNNLYKMIGAQLKKKVKIIYLPDFIFSLMMRVNKLQLLLCRLFGNLYISNEKLKNKFPHSKNL